MKIHKMVRAAIVMGIFLGCLYTPTAHGQNMNLWLGKWLKLSIQVKGYEFSGNSFYPDAVKFPAYAHVTQWDSATLFLRGSLYIQNDEGEWEESLFPLHFIGGTNLDFLCQFYMEATEGVDRVINSFVARVTGKMKGGGLSTVSFKSLGGYHLSNDPSPDGDFVAGLTVTGSLVSELKVPPGIPR